MTTSSHLYKTDWQTLQFFPWLQIRTVCAETMMGVAAWNEYRWMPKKGAK